MVRFLLLFIFAFASHAHRHQEPLRFISIDGGGMIALVPLLLLEEIEQQSGSRMAYLVDGVIGASSGGLTAAALCAPNKVTGYARFTVSEIIKLYEESVSRAFTLQTGLNAVFTVMGMAQWANYEASARDLEGLYQEKLGDVYLSQSICNSMMLAYNQRFQRFELFDSDLAKNPAHDAPMWQAMRATTALTTAFGAATVQFNTSDSVTDLIDAGEVGYVDPTIFLIQKIERNYPNRKAIIYSLGTGFGDNKYIREYMAGKNPNIHVIRLSPYITDSIIQLNLIGALPRTDYTAYFRPYADALKNTPEYRKMFEDLTGMPYIAIR